MISVGWNGIAVGQPYDIRSVIRQRTVFDTPAGDAVTNVRLSLTMVSRVAIAGRRARAGTARALPPANSGSTGRSVGARFNLGG